MKNFFNRWITPNNGSQELDIKTDPEENTETEESSTDSNEEQEQNRIDFVRKARKSREHQNGEVLADTDDENEIEKGLSTKYRNKGEIDFTRQESIERTKNLVGDGTGYSIREMKKFRRRKRRHYSEGDGSENDASSSSDSDA